MTIPRQLYTIEIYITHCSHFYRTAVYAVGIEEGNLEQNVKSKTCSKTVIGNSLLFNAVAHANKSPKALMTRRGTENNLDRRGNLEHPYLFSCNSPSTS